jgi:transposase-like protein
MTLRKLSDSDKQEILALYRTTAETSSTLAAQFGVSTSTVSRILKTSLSEQEYEGLIQQKRGRSLALPVAELPVVALPVVELPVSSPKVPAQLEMPLTNREPDREEDKGRRSRKRTSTAASPPVAESATMVEDQPLGLADIAPVAEMVDRTLSIHSEIGYADEATELEEILADELIHQHALDEGDDEDDLDDFGDDEDEDDFDEDDSPSDLSLIATSGLRAGAAIQVLPLASAPLPRTCYFVVDRSAELVARPLSDFGDLGQIPRSETQEKTLPLFDNHRVAKRFSNPRTQRVIKLPDSRILQKTMSHLQAKGITRLLIDGRVYALADDIPLEDELPIE